MLDLDRLHSRVQAMLGEKRYRHCLGVEETAARFGTLLGLDIEKLRAAALLHDIGKSISPEEQILYADENRLSLTDDDRKAKGTIHAVVGAKMAEADFGITDGEILLAVRFHATGCSGMGLFQKTIFVSDYLDPYRGFANQQEFLKKTMDNFEEGVLAIIAVKISFVLKKGEHLHPLSVDFYNRQLSAVHDDDIPPPQRP